MAKRYRDEATQVVTEAKRHAPADAWQHPENHWVHQQSLGGPPPGWDALTPACKAQLAPPLPGAALPEPLHPANHAAAAAEGGEASSQQQQDQQQQQQREDLAALGGALNIDWRSPEAAASFLRTLHLERLHRLGQQLPAEYHRTL